MSETEMRRGPLIEPAYPQAEISAPISFGRHAFEAQVTESTQRGAIDATLVFVPEDRLVFDVVEDQGEASRTALASFFGGGTDRLTLVDRGVSFDVIQTGISRFVPTRSVVSATGQCGDIVRCVFHLFNFPDFFSPTDYAITEGEGPYSGWTRCGRVRLQAGGWVITIAALRCTHDRLRALRERGGWALTHVGEVVREDGAPYSSDQLEDILQCIHHCLSFAIGRWAASGLPVGFDATGARRFEQWGLPRAAGGYWNPSACWFDDRHGEMLPGIFSGFWNLWRQTLWRGPISEAIYWYLGASDRGVGIGVDTGLIVAQTALELLAWNYCVRDRAMISAKAFDPRGLSAADRLRLLASGLGLSLALPAEVSALHAKRGEKWADAMDAITCVRNALVHPHEERKLATGSEYDAWRLSLWYLDLIILRLCGYQGQYASRLRPHRFAGEVEPVPWASVSPPTGDMVS